MADIQLSSVVKWYAFWAKNRGFLQVILQSCGSQPELSVMDSLYQLGLENANSWQLWIFLWHYHNYHEGYYLHSETYFLL